MKHIWCNDFPEIYAQLEEGWGQSAMGVCALCYIYMKCISCTGFAEIYAQLEEGGGVNLPWVYVHCAISPKFGVAVFKASMLDCRGQSAMHICALCYI